MKKVNKPNKQIKKKLPTADAIAEINPFIDIIETMDEGTVAALLHSMQIEMGFGPESLCPEDPVGLFSEYLEACVQVDDDDEKIEFIADLFDALDRLRVDCNGGDPDARGAMQAIYDLLDDAIENHSLQGPDLMMIGKLLYDAGWAVPDSLKRALTEVAQAQTPDVGGASAEDLVSTLLEAADHAGQNSFEAHTILSSLLACFTSEACAALLSELIAGKHAALSQAAAGFLLHQDAHLAQSVAATLAASAGKTPVESSLIERLVRIRPWLPQARQIQLDTTIKAMRLNALPPIKLDAPKIIDCYASVCDGSGTRSLFVTQRLGRRYQIATVMMKTCGVADALVIREISKSEMDDIVREMRSSIAVAGINSAAITRMLALAISDNLVSGNPPPFKLVEVVESLALGPIHPDTSSSAEIISSLLDTLPPEQISGTAVAKAHTDILDIDFVYQWFEAGEQLEDLLYSVKGSKRRAAKLMKDYLPGRRAFWARQCAVSALVLQLGAKSDHAPWKQLALVGRDIASDLPLEEIPLMNQIAELSVRVFESRLF